MLNPLKLFFKVIIYCSLIGFFFSCTTTKTVQLEKTLTEREMIYQKGLSLYSISKYSEAMPFFIKVIHQNHGPTDELYSSSLWCLSIIYERQGDYDKSLLSLLELEERKPANISYFKIQLGLAKNYFRLDNTKKAKEVMQLIDISKPQLKLSFDELYFSSLENCIFNFDQTLIDELLYLKESQKYFLYVMESGQAKINQDASDSLQAIYSDFLKVIDKSNLEYSFRRKVAVQILDNLRVLDIYKLDDKTSDSAVKKYFNFSQKKQTELVDWLHQ